jgi:hypothetical protein
MIHPIPAGTRDVLPDEMRELRRLHGALIDVLEARGYGEVATPAIEYDEVLSRGEGRATGSAYRFFDESGDLLALRSDMTVPIARLVSSRFADAEIDRFDDAEFAEFEALIEVQDRDLFDWLAGKVETPANFDTPVFRRLVAFHAEFPTTEHIG